MVQVPSQKVKIEDIQPYVILRGLLLTPEEKKKVILESNQSLEGKLTTRKVIDSVRMLGARFFNEMSGLKKPQRTKVYDPNTLITQDEDVQPEASLQAEECSEGEFLEALVGEGDDDATLAADFEQAAAEVLQDNPELHGQCILSLPRRAQAPVREVPQQRLLAHDPKFFVTERQGIWNGSKVKFGGKGKRGGGFERPRRSLQERILCRQHGTLEGRMSFQGIVLNCQRQHCSELYANNDVDPGRPRGQIGRSHAAGVREAPN